MAIANPIAHEPLHKPVNGRSKVIIEFNSASGAYFHRQRTDFRRTAIEVIVEELRKACVPLDNITRCCRLAAPQSVPCP